MTPTPRRAGTSGRATPRGVRPAPRLGRPPLVDRESIVRAAAEVGFGRITMTTVAEHLGTRHSTLYRYFATRDDLVTATVDLVVSEAAWPQPGGDWSAVLRDHAWATFRLLEHHPGLAAQITSLRVASPAYDQVGQHVVLALLDLGFAAEDAILAHDLVHENVLQFFLAGRPHDGTETGPEAAADRRREILRDALADVDPRLREPLTRIVHGPPRAWFTRKLDVLLSGIVRLAPTPPADE